MSETNIFLKCDCNSETAVFTKYNYVHIDTDYTLSIEDAYCNGDYMGIKGRFKRAWMAFWAKPICYNSVFCGDPERMRKFLEDCLSLMDEDGE